VSVAPASGQAAPEQKPVMVEDVFKNIQVLKGIPVSEIQPNVPIDAGKFAKTAAPVAPPKPAPR
jgi:hypothetical protein